MLYLIQSCISQLTAISCSINFSKVLYSNITGLCVESERLGAAEETTRRCRGSPGCHKYRRQQRPKKETHQEARGQRLIKCHLIIFKTCNLIAINDIRHDGLILQSCFVMRLYLSHLGVLWLQPCFEM